MSLWTPTFNLLNPKVSGWGRRTVSVGGGGGDETALSRIQAAFQNGDFAAYWGIQDGITYNNTSRQIDDTTTSGGVALMPDKAGFVGTETVDEYVTRVGATGLAADNLPGFIGYQDGASFEPRMDSSTSPKFLEQGNADENLRIRNATGYVTGSTSHTIVIALRTTDFQFFTIADTTGATKYAGYVQNLATSADQLAGSATYRVDGSSVGSNASDLVAAGVNDGTWRVLTIESLDLSGWAGDMIIGGRVEDGTSGFNMDGDIAYVAIFPDDTTTRDLAEAEASF